MGLESGSYISALVSTNPVGATDPKSQGDDHLRFIKAKLLETFANVTGAVTSTHTELNLVAGATGGLATLSVSFAALATLVSQMGTLSASVTSSDITGSIRTPVLQTQAGFTAGTFTAATVVVSNKGIITGITAGTGVTYASTAETQTGSETAKAVTPAGLKGAIGFSKFFESAEQTIAVNTTLTVAHSLGAKPKLVWSTLICKTAELGYSVGDEQLQLLYGASGNDHMPVTADATNLVCHVLGNLFLLHKTTRAETGYTAANWRIILRAEA